MNKLIKDVCSIGRASGEELVGDCCLANHEFEICRSLYIWKFLQGSSNLSANIYIN